MKKELIGIFIFLTFCSCKEEDNPETGTGFTGHLNLSRQWFTSFPNNVKKEEKYESAVVNFIKANFNYDAGAVKYGDSILKKQLVGYYYLSFNPDSVITDYRPLYEGGKLWSVSGNSDNDIPSFVAIAPNYPTFLLMKFDTLPVIHKNLPFTLNWGSSIPCDSLSIYIGQSYNNAQTGTISGHISSFTFTPSKLSVFDRYQKAYIVMEGKNYKKTKVSGMQVVVETYVRRNCEVYVLD